MTDPAFVKTFPAGNTALAVRAPPQTPAADLAQALGLAQGPVLLLSGGAGGMSEKLLNKLWPAFELIGNVLVQEGITVLDGGTDSGVMRLMGRALVQAGRIAPHVGVLPARAEAAPQGVTGEDVLDPNHSHFVLVDSDQWGDEIHTMGELAVHLAGEVKPVVLLANGGEVSLQDLEWHAGRGHRILVLAGSGRLADELSRAIRRPKRRARPRVAAIAGAGNCRVFDCTAIKPECVVSLRGYLKGEPTVTDKPKAPEGKEALFDAWSSFARYDHNAKSTRNQYLRLRTCILFLGVGATALAILYAWSQAAENPGLPQQILRYTVIALPIIISILQAGSAQFRGGTNYVLLRGSAEALKSEIYRYRAKAEIYSPANTASEPREIKLARKVKTIGGQLMKSEANQSMLKPYTGKLPPIYEAVDNPDDGFEDLKADRYLALRLEDQLNWYHAKTQKIGRRWRRAYWYIIILGGIGTLLAALGLEIWVAVTVALGGALTSLLQLQADEQTLISYNQAATDLEGVRIWWHALPEEDRNKQENKNKLVRYTEGVLQTELAGWVQQMMDALSDLYEEEGNGDGKETEEGGQQAPPVE